jgi:hypothetical protein
VPSSSNRLGSTIRWLADVTTERIKRRPVLGGLADRARADPMPQAEQFSLDAAMAPGRIVAGEADHQRP